MVRVQPEKTPSVTEKPKDVEKAKGNSNISESINDKQGLLENTDKKAAENSIVTTTKPNEITEEK